MADAATKKPPTVVELVWEHDLVLSGRAGERAITLDSDSGEGPSPMQTLGAALAGCMAMDVIHILKKGRHPLRGLRADLTGHRASEEPRRFTRVELKYTVVGEIPGTAVERAIELSRGKYCSVWQSMRQDIDLQVTFEIDPGA